MERLCNNVELYSVLLLLGISPDMLPVVCWGGLLLEAAELCTVGKDTGKDVLYLIVCSPVCLSLIVQLSPAEQVLISKHTFWLLPTQLSLPVS